MQKKARGDKNSNYTETEEKNIKKIYKYCKDHMVLKKNDGDSNYRESIALFKDLDNIETGVELSHFFDKKFGYYEPGPLVFSNEDHSREITLLRKNSKNILTNIKAPGKNDLQFEGSPAGTVKMLQAILKDESAVNDYVKGMSADEFLKNYHGYKINDKKIKLEHPGLQQVFNDAYDKINSPDKILERASEGKDVNVYKMFKIVNNKEKQRHDVVNLKTGKIIGCLEDPNFKIE